MHEVGPADDGAREAPGHRFPRAERARPPRRGQFRSESLPIGKTVESSSPLNLPRVRDREKATIIGRTSCSRISTGASRWTTEKSRSAARWAAEAVRRCGYLTLAVRIAAAKLAARPRMRIGELVSRRADEQRSLGELTPGDVEVRTSFALSYRELSPVTTPWPADRRQPLGGQSFLRQQLHDIEQR